MNALTVCITMMLLLAFGGIVLIAISMCQALFNQASFIGYASGIAIGCGMIYVAVCGMHYLQ